MLTLNRKLIPANLQVHRHDFTVTNLIGFDLHGKTIGIIGTGKIGSTLIRILQGFDCRILTYDIHQNEELTKRYNFETTYYNIRGWEADAGCVNDLTAIRIHGHLSGV